MKINNSYSRASRNKRYRFFSLPIIMLAFLSGGAHAVYGGDPHRYQENGKLTEVEKNKSSSIAIISNKGYSVDPSALIVNAAGRPISLEKLTIPTDVNFEYSYKEYKPKQIEPVIVFIQETKMDNTNKRSME